MQCLTFLSIKIVLLHRKKSGCSNLHVEPTFTFMKKLVRAIPDPMPLGKVLVPGGMSFFMLALSVVDLVIVGTGGCVCVG